MDRRTFLQAAATAASALGMPVSPRFLNYAAEFPEQRRIATNNLSALAGHLRVLNNHVSHGSIENWQKLAGSAIAPGAFFDALHGVHISTKQLKGLIGRRGPLFQLLNAECEREQTWREVLHRFEAEYGIEKVKYALWRAAPDEKDLASICRDIIGLETIRADGLAAQLARALKAADARHATHVGKLMRALPQQAAGYPELSQQLAFVREPDGLLPKSARAYVEALDKAVLEDVMQRFENRLNDHYNRLPQDKFRTAFDKLQCGVEDWLSDAHRRGLPEEILSQLRPSLKDMVGKLPIRRQQFWQQKGFSGERPFSRHEPELQTQEEVSPSKNSELLDAATAYCAREASDGTPFYTDHPWVASSTGFDHGKTGESWADSLLREGLYGASADKLR